MPKVLAIVAIALVAHLVPSCGHTRKAEFRNGQFGWTLSYPPSLQKTVVDIKGFVSWNGVVVSNFDGVTARKWLEFHRFPRDGVAFGFLYRGGGPAPDTSPPEARFPLAPAGFTVARYTQKPAPKPQVLGIVANGEPFLAEVWFGPDASRGSREAIWDIVRSLRFPPQQTGTMSGDFYVLEDASHYPPGSVTRFPGKAFPDYSYVPPFYLVHAPGGFYAVAWKPEFEPKCEMKVARARLEFYCSAMRGRWDRMGRPIVSLKRQYRRYNNFLDRAQVKIGRDGQLLVGGGMNPGNADENRFWPTRG